VVDLTAVVDALGRIEQKLVAIATTPPSHKDFWDKLGAASSLVTGVLLAVVAWFLSGRVEQQLKAREAEITQGAAVKDLLVSISSSDPARSGERRAAALALAAFGEGAVGPLVSSLYVPGLGRADSVEDGIRQVALRRPEVVCGALGSMLEAPGPSWPWTAERAAAELAGELGCRGALPSLDRWRELLAAPSAQALAALAERVRPEPPVTEAALLELRGAVGDARKRLGRR